MPKFKKKKKQAYIEDDECSKGRGEGKIGKERRPPSYWENP